MSLLYVGSYKHIRDHLASWQVITLFIGSNCTGHKIVPGICLCNIYDVFFEKITNKVMV
jgi:hypothetical protein